MQRENNAARFVENCIIDENPRQCNVSVFCTSLLKFMRRCKCSGSRDFVIEIVRVQKCKQNCQE